MLQVGKLVLRGFASVLPMRETLSDALAAPRPPRSRQVGRNGLQGYPLLSDSTAEAVERTRFAGSLAKTHGARLIGVDAQRAAGGQGSGDRGGRHPDVRRGDGEASPAAIFVPVDQPGEGDLFSHCVDLMIAPGPESLAHDVIRRALLPSHRALLESGVEPRHPGRRSHRRRHFRPFETSTRGCSAG